MRKRVSIIILSFFCLSHLARASSWTEETARQEAFRNVQYHIDVSQYPAFDPDFQENQKALKAGIEEIADRFVTKNDEPPIDYVVSKLDEKRRPRITMFYGSDGHLITVRLFSESEYPRIAYIYCVENNLRDGDKVFKSGELMSVSFRVSEEEEFYFNADGKCTGVVRF